LYSILSRVEIAEVIEGDPDVPPVTVTIAGDPPQAYLKVRAVKETFLANLGRNPIFGVAVARRRTCAGRGRAAIPSRGSA